MKDIVAPLIEIGERPLGAVLAEVFVPDARIQLCHPFETLEGPEALAQAALGPLMVAMPDLERRETIRMAGHDAHGQDWVGICGYYCGAWTAPFLGMPPTGRMAALRFHEFFRVVDGKVVELQGLWDLPDLMMQAGVWPMGPALGREWQVPGPATQDGLRIGGDGAAALAVVGAMLEGLGRSTEGPEAMRLGDFWHPKCSWYGPAGIGTARGIDGFRRHHQIPFLNAMPDRRAVMEQGHFFAEGDYVAFTGWPGMEMTVSGSGWLGIAPAGQEITMRSLDFWRVERGMIRENWVLVDLLQVYHQLGVDVLARMEELVGWSKGSA